MGERRLEIFGHLRGLFRTGRLADLGAGHGLFSILAAKAGWDVVAVDARTERNTPAPGVKWVESDVRVFSLEGYDFLACLGLFYHLPVDDQIDLLRRSSGTPMIIDTHLANGRSIHRYPKRWRYTGTPDQCLERKRAMARPRATLSRFGPRPNRSFECSTMLDTAS
jgi:hypothetical protein